MLDLNTFDVNKAILVSLSTLLLPVAIAFPIRVTAQTNVASADLLLAQAQSTAIEAEILAEINRARTQPQAYADWLEQQQQYYEGIVLRLPGEKTIRTNRGFRALREAIAFLRQQQPLPPLSSSESLVAAAKSQLETIANFTSGNNINIDNISYGMVTPQAIVMQLIVDDRFPDRRRRKSLFTSQSEQAGIVCQPDQRYDNICAIAYKPNGEIASDSDTPADTNSNTATLPAPTPPQTAENSIPDIVSSPTEETVESPDSENLPIEVEVPSAETVADTEVANQEEANTSEEVAVTQNDSRLLEKVERGILETGDRTIPDDGSFYDSYPLEGNAGESFVISLESDEFDTFVAIMDAEGNILEQNDDISDDNSNSRLQVTLPDDGVYNVIVNAYDEGGTGSYVLTISR